MSRPLRIEYEGAWYHVMNRGRARQKTFRDEAGYRAFLDTVAEAIQRFSLEVHAYCLMPNHYHLLVRTPAGNLGRAMRHVDGVYTQRHNRQVNTDGPLFRGRYRAILVDADEYLLSVSRYIHRNPVDGVKPLVRRPDEWPWSSYGAYINVRKGPAWLTREPVYEALGQRQRYRAYGTFVESGVEDEVAQFYGNQRAIPVLGGDPFRRRALDRAGDVSEIARRERQRVHTPEEVLEAVAGEYRLAATTFTTSARGASAERREARQVAMRLCRDETELTLKEIGVHFGDLHYSGVSQNIRRLERAMEKEVQLVKRYQSAKSRLDP